MYYSVSQNKLHCIHPPIVTLHFRHAETNEAFTKFIQVSQVSHSSYSHVAVLRSLKFLMPFSSLFARFLELRDLFTKNIHWPAAYNSRIQRCIFCHLVSACVLIHVLMTHKVALIWYLNCMPNGWIQFYHATNFSDNPAELTLTIDDCHMQD